MAFEALPIEMRSCPQWIAWRRVWNERKLKYDKVPVSAIHGHNSATNNPDDWCEFNRAYDYVARYPEALAGVGFNFGYASRMGGVDLDGVFDSTGAVQDGGLLEIGRRFNSYTEYSPSYEGLHVFFIGDVPSGRRHQGVELYGQGRFFTVTGQAYHPVALRNCQHEADVLTQEIDQFRARIGRPSIEWNVEQKISDEELWRRCSTAANGDKFLRLFNGDWRTDYGTLSQSEADLALINIIAYHTDCPSQVSRAFHVSKLYRPEKKYRAYVQRMVEYSFDKKVPLVAIPALPVPPVVAASPVTSKTELDAEEQAWLDYDVYTRPAGLVGDIMDYVQAAAPYPHKEMGLATALTLMAGICGRQFQVNGAGLNLYTMVLADTGMGKEQMLNGANTIMNSVIRPENDIANMAVPTVSSDTIGFAAASSFMGPGKLTGKGLLRMFDAKGNCHNSLSAYCILSEFAGTLGRIASIGRGTVDSGTIDLKQHLLEIFPKSSAGQIYGGSLTADKETSVGVLMAPAFTFLCENTPQGIWDILSEALVKDGLLPRMLIIEVPRRTRNTVYNPNFMYAKVPTKLTHDVTYLAQLVYTLKANQDQRIHCQFAAGAAERLDAFRVYANERLDGTHNDAYRDLWNRTHLIASKIAALLAIGVGGSQPIITVDQVNYAAALVTRQVTLLIGKFKRGEVGQGSNVEQAQYELVLKVITEFMAYGSEELPSKWQKYADLRRGGMVSHSLVQSFVHNHAPFRDPRSGGPAGLKRTMQALCDTGVLKPARIEEKQGQYYSVSL